MRILQRMLYALAKSPPFASSSSRFLVSADVSALCVFLRESLVNLLLFGHRVALLAGLSRQTSAPLTNSPPFASSSNRFLGWIFSSCISRTCVPLTKLLPFASSSSHFLARRSCPFVNEVYQCASEVFSFHLVIKPLSWLDSTHLA